MIRCTAKNFHKRRCLNQVMSVDPKFCHIHSADHAFQRCLATDSRNMRRCRRKAVSESAFCFHHQPVLGHETGRFKAGKKSFFRAKFRA